MSTLPSIIIGENNDWINFAEKEKVGVEYLRVAHKTLDTVTSDSPAFAENIKAWDETDKGGAELLGITQKINDLKTTLQAGNADDGLSKTRDLIATISDNSNITLDPDNNTYFLGDVIVNQVPGVLVQISNLLKAVEGLRAIKNDTNKIAYAESRNDLVISASNIVADIQKSIQGGEESNNGSIIGNIEKIIKGNHVDSDAESEKLLDGYGKEIAADIDKLTKISQTEDYDSLVVLLKEMREKVIVFNDKCSV
jgi:hypothetical protein